jgi:hypothetical protein
VNGPLEATVPPSPVLAAAPPVVGQPPVVVAVARAPVDANRNPYEPQAQDPQYGDAYWLKTTTIYSPQRAVLENLQKHVIDNLAVRKIVTWTLVQRAPGVGANAGQPEREAAENDAIGGKNVQVTKMYEYYKFSGAYDSETHQALCDMFYATQALAQAAAAGSSPTPVQVSCQNLAGNDMPYLRTYWTVDPGPSVAVGPFKGDLGTYVGAHVNAYNVK